MEEVREGPSSVPIVWPFLIGSVVANGVYSGLIEWTKYTEHINGVASRCWQR